MSRLLKSEEPVTADKAHPDATIRTPRRLIRRHRAPRLDREEVRMLHCMVRVWRIQTDALCRDRIAQQFSLFLLKAYSICGAIRESPVDHDSMVLGVDA